jgi:hypothetical protein
LFSSIQVYELALKREFDRHRRYWENKKRKRSENEPNIILGIGRCELHGGGEEDEEGEAEGKEEVKK